MVGDLITLPLRLWFRSAELVTRAAVGATERAVSLAGHAIQTVAPGVADSVTNYAPPPPAEEERPHAVEEQLPGEEQSPVEGERPHVRDERRPAEPSGLPSDPRRELVEDRVPAPEPRVERLPTPPENPAPQAQTSPPSATPMKTPGEEPVHVSEEPELVREEAERGAEEGAGAGVTVMEPWEGYAQMSAREVAARIESASAAELAAVRLYESHHRGRQTVLAAVDRQLKTANRSGRLD